MKIADYLLKYRTYLLYNVEVDVKNKKGYQAINYFLDNVDKVSPNFFRNLVWFVTKPTIKPFNTLILKCKKLGFILENLDIEFDDYLDSYENTPKYAKLPMIEFTDTISFPFDRHPPVKECDLLDLCEQHVEVSDVDKISFLFNSLSILLKSAKNLYDYQYEFKSEHITTCKSILLNFDVDSDEYTIETVTKVIKYLWESFQEIMMIRLEGPKITLTKFFELVTAIKQFDVDNKIQLEFDKPNDVSDDLNSEDSSSTEEELQFKVSL